MGLNYDKYKKQQEEGNNQWASYSDLFMVLSFVFLLLYVVSSLRNSAFSIKQNIEYQRLVAKTEELDRQVKVYDSLKQDYLDKQASKDEQETYDRLMAQLDLVKSETQAKQEQLKEQIAESKKKEAALNEYQEAIRNIINANMVAKSRIKKRDSLIKQRSVDIANQKNVIYEKSEVISDKTKKVAYLKNEVKDKEEQIASNEATIQNLEQEKQTQIAKLNEAFKKNEITKKQFEEKISKVQAESSEKLAALEELKGKISQELQSTNQKLSQAETSLAQTEKSLEAANENLESLEGEIEAQTRKVASLSDEVGQLGEKNQKLAGDLEKMKEIAFAKQNLAGKIQKVLEANGIKGNVDKETGEVEIHFDEYFDTGKFALKASMRKTLNKFIPLYSKTLFEDKEISKNIKSVEIVGFASPTYKGKLLDPSTLRPEDRAGVDFNLNLSFFRARSIFKHIFDVKQLKFEKQKQLQKVIKVTGRSFLAEEIKGRNIASTLSRKQFCAQYNCVKSQKVIIKFNME